MKSLKIESEISSSMKSTIKYTFVAPGAIGKGRGQGQGLKSLGERGQMITKSLVSGEQGQGLKYLGDKGHATTKSLVSDQSSDLVKQNIQKFETSLTGNGRGQGLENSTLYTSQGMGMIHKNSMALENENKQGNGRGQGLETSTLYTSQGMRMIHKNFMALENENKQSLIGKGRGQGFENSML